MTRKGKEHHPKYLQRSTHKCIFIAFLNCFFKKKFYLFANLTCLSLHLSSTSQYLSFSFLLTLLFPLLVHFPNLITLTIHHSTCFSSPLHPDLLTLSTSRSQISISTLSFTTSSSSLVIYTQFCSALPPYPCSTSFPATPCSFWLAFLVSHPYPSTFTLALLLLSLEYLTHILKYLRHLQHLHTSF